MHTANYFVFTTTKVLSLIDGFCFGTICTPFEYLASDSLVMRLELLQVQILQRNRIEAKACVVSGLSVLLWSEESNINNIHTAIVFKKNKCSIV